MCIRDRGLSETGYFGFTLHYDAGFTKNQYNGNISGMRWRSKGDGEQRAYGYDYDGANRLLKADFTQYSAGAFNQSGGVNFNVLMGDGVHPALAYDANGNIKKMQQWGLKLNGSTQIDNLIYEYKPNSNKLLSVSENSLGNTDNKLGDFTDKNTSNDDYDYDLNGNLKYDKNKSISSITYN